MGLKDELNKVGDAAKNVVENVKDSASEAGHRSAAEGQQARRDVAGDQMTVGEKIGSVADQAKNSVQGDVDAAKREGRNAL